MQRRAFDAADGDFGKGGRRGKRAGQQRRKPQQGGGGFMVMGSVCCLRASSPQAQQATSMALPDCTIRADLCQIRACCQISRVRNTDQGSSA